MKAKCGTEHIIVLFSEFDNMQWMIEKSCALLDREEGIVVRSSRYATVLQFSDCHTGEHYYFKEFHSRGFKDRLKNLFGITRSKMAFYAGKLLLKSGFQTPMPILFGVTKSIWFREKNFLITRGVPGLRTYAYFETYFPLPLSNDKIAEKRALLQAGGHEIGRLHRAGIVHGDLRVGNIIINGQGSNAELCFIDNERTKDYRFIPHRKRIKNLVQLNMFVAPQITRTDRLRFFSSYLKENPSLLPDKKELLKEIRQLTLKRSINKSLSSAAFFRKDSDHGNPA